MFRAGLKTGPYEDFLDNQTGILYTDSSQQGGHIPRRKVYHLKFTKNRWALKRPKAKQATRTYPTKEKALKQAPRIIRNQKPSQLKIHKKNGKFQEERTYGKDPYPPKG